MIQLEMDMLYDERNDVSHLKNGPYCIPWTQRNAKQISVGSRPLVVMTSWIHTRGSSLFEYVWSVCRIYGYRI